MPEPITLTVDGTATTVEPGTTGTDLFGSRKDVVVVRVDGELRDLHRELPAGAVVEAVTIGSPEGLEVLRHSAAHVLAQAVQEVNPAARLGIGPPITDGFYYDFDVETPFTAEDLRALEKVMARIVKEGQTFRRVDVTEDEARALEKEEPYKLELIGLKGAAGDEDGASVEVGLGGLTVYQNVRGAGRESEQVVWQDLCRGPHVPSTRVLGNGFQLTRSAAAYWRGSEKNPQLQRVYGTAWPTKDELKAHLDRLAEAERRDHRRLGTELDLFSFPDEIGSGLAVFHPRGGIVRMEMEEYSRRRHVQAGYSFVNTPHITKEHLFQVSGHLDWYAEGMYPPMQLDEERDADGTVRKQGQNYYLKPMNCPMHNLVFAARGRSYRELPLRLFEFGTVYRYEKSGVVHGMTRARGFTQDDAHIYCTREQMAGELTSLLTFVLDLLKDYGLEDFYLELSTRNPEKSVGSDEAWEEATETLRSVAEASGLQLVPDPGGAAFYGPKISVQAKDAIGRTWQMSTIQLDFNLPERFELEYTAPDGTRQRPVMIHRALFGSIERFFAVLTEHYAGAFPAWLAPVQVLAIPVAEPFEGYLAELVERLRAEGIRAEVDRSDDRFGKKIRNAAKEKVPFVLIAGGEDVEAGAVSFRFRDGRQENGVPVDEAVARVLAAVRDRVQV
ncbi:threonine--tRNA ligase [Cellulomonas marina]|uniref:Threonine--tRNA ligase n=1 Tax=Cellulomonas marina TaxID=988821 RepID=A0A1I0W6E0_9CELL|nr:threonine--tRNA ligase [Cellulomonas marina]GIG30522.1 threonine--tRNA ligase [Cellulomonas marina]SFA83897.1 threonyl-tRNA synthetase [Cellulomonas marina]